VHCLKRTVKANCQATSALHPSACEKQFIAYKAEMTFNVVGGSVKVSKFCKCPPSPQRILPDTNPARLRLIRQFEKKWVNGMTLKYHFLKSREYAGPKTYQVQSITVDHSIYTCCMLRLHFADYRCHLTKLLCEISATFRLSLVSSSASRSLFIVHGLRGIPPTRSASS
jgi:hypothetical protein